MNCMGIWKGILIGFGIVLLTAVVFGGVEGYFYFQGKSYAVRIPLTQNIVQVGKIPQSSYSPNIEASFSKSIDRFGEVVLTPLYVDNMIIDKWDGNGNLYAHDFVTGQKKLYYWTDNTAYVCIDTQQIKVNPGNPKFQQPDPKTTLDHFVFIFKENGLRGDQDASGFFHFDSDVKPGLPVKLILQNRTPADSDGGFNLLNIFLFTNNPCSTKAI